MQSLIILRRLKKEKTHQGLTGKTTPFNKLIALNSKIKTHERIQTCISIIYITNTNRTQYLQNSISQSTDRAKITEKSEEK